MRLSCVVLIALMSLKCADSFASAGCVLPEPDGGVQNPTPANIIGETFSVQQDIVIIRVHGVDKDVPVKIDRAKPIYYTAFGGFFTPDKLRVGQAVRIWLMNCNRAVDISLVPSAAYFEIFSEDPSDRPDVQYWSGH